VPVLVIIPSVDWLVLIDSTLLLVSVTFEAVLLVASTLLASVPVVDSGLEVDSVLVLVAIMLVVSMTLVPDSFDGDVVSTLLFVSGVLIVV
jgi:hypothetical protein